MDMWAMFTRNMWSLVVGWLTAVVHTDRQ